MDRRGTLQCRTHGQKYIIRLSRLKADIEASLSSETKGATTIPLASTGDKDFYSRINKYESERRSLLTMLLSQEPRKTKRQIVTDCKIIPDFMGEDCLRNFSEKLDSMLMAINSELEAVSS